MENKIRNRGRPTKDTPTEPYLKAQLVEVTLPPINGLICPHCGRAMVPRVINTAGVQRTISCTLCGGRMRAIYEEDGMPVLVRKL